MKKEPDFPEFENTGMFYVNPDVRWTTLGAVIKRVRLDNKLTLRELGLQVGCSHVFLSKVENGQKLPSEELLAKLQLALGIRGIVSRRDNISIESSSLAYLIYHELFWLPLSAAQRKSAGLILSTLRRAGQKPVVRAPSQSEAKRGIRAVLEVPGTNNQRFHITISDGNE